jgi:glutamate synthase domain-containing protein 1
MVAHLKGVASHEIVRDANTMLVRMAHRGGCGCEPNSGDGAGILTGMPDAFLRRVMSEEGVELPVADQYGAGNIFFPADAAATAECKALVEAQVEAQGMRLLGWRPLPVDNSELGPTSLASEPHTEMLLVAPTAELPVADLNRELWRLRILAAKAVHREPSFEARAAPPPRPRGAAHRAARARAYRRTSTCAPSPRRCSCTKGS